MLVATTDNKGRKIYINAFTGIEEKLKRVAPGKTGRLPDYALRFLSQYGSVSEPHQQPVSDSRPVPRINMANRVKQIKQPKPRRMGWFKKLVNWLKSLV